MLGNWTNSFFNFRVEGSPLWSWDWWRSTMWPSVSLRRLRAQPHSSRSSCLVFSWVAFCWWWENEHSGVHIRFRLILYHGRWEDGLIREPVAAAYYDRPGTDVGHRTQFQRARFRGGPLHQPLWVVRSILLLHRPVLLSFLEFFFKLERFLWLNWILYEENRYRLSIHFKIFTSLKSACVIRVVERKVLEHQSFQVVIFIYLLLGFSIFSPSFPWFNYSLFMKIRYSEVVKSYLSNGNRVSGWDKLSSNQN